MHRTKVTMEVENSFVNNQSCTASMVDMISSDLSPTSHPIGNNLTNSAVPFTSTVSCTSSPACHSVPLMATLNDSARTHSFSSSKMYLPTGVSKGSSQCSMQSLHSPLEQKPVIGNSETTQCSVDNLSQSSTPAIMSLTISNDNDYTTDLADDESLKESQSDYPWISKEKKSTRKQHQGWYTRTAHCG